MFLRSPAAQAARGAVVVVATGVLAACAVPPPADPARTETILGLTTDGQMVSFNAGRPDQLLGKRALQGLPAAERLVAIDFRVSRGQLYGLGASGQLYRLDPLNGRATAVGSAPARPVAGKSFGFDFNPTVDRIRVVSDTGLNLRLHPDTGEAIDADPATPGLQPDGPLAYVTGDRHAGQVPLLLGAAYTYNKQNEKITTNYAIDARQRTLVIQGSREGEQPVVSPNTGRLTTVGPLGVELGDEVGFDIADTSNAAFVSSTRQGRTTLYLLDLGTGSARRLGVVGGGVTLAGIAVEP